MSLIWVNRRIFRDRAAPSLLFLAVFSLLFPILVSSCQRAEAPDPVGVTLETPDGLRLSAWRYDPGVEQPPGLILVHRRGATAAVWAPFAERARQAGYQVVAMDLRGHGESRQQAAGALDYREFGPPDWSGVLQDIEAARACLLAAGADPENIFIAGEGLGGGLALQYTVQNADIQGVVLVSPGLDEVGIDTAALIQQLTDRPCVVLWSEGDAYAAAAAATLIRLAPAHLESHAYPGAAHGTDLFSVSDQAMGQILVWLKQIRTPQPGAGLDFEGPTPRKS